MDVQRSWQPIGKKANSFLEREEKHPASVALHAKAQGANEEEAAPMPGCPDEGQQATACLSRQEVLKGHLEDHHCRELSRTKEGPGFLLDERAVCGRVVPTQGAAEGSLVPEPEGVGLRPRIPPKRVVIQ